MRCCLRSSGLGATYYQSSRLRHHPCPSDKQDSVGALLLIGQAVAKGPGAKPGIAMTATLTCIQENTSLTTETLCRALPAAETPSVRSTPGSSGV